MDELRRILGGTNSKYIEETKARWQDFCAKVQFYGVWKKALKPPFPLSLHGGKLLFHIPNVHCNMSIPNPAPRGHSTVHINIVMDCALLRYCAHCSYHS